MAPSSVSGASGIGRQVLVILRSPDVILAFKKKKKKRDKKAFVPVYFALSLGSVTHKFT